jgi:hypothetical protein
VEFDKDPAQDIIDPIIPSHAVPVDVITRQHTRSIRTRRLGWRTLAANNPPQEVPESVIGLLPTMDRWEASLLRDLEWHVSEDEVWEKLTRATCQFATDGSAPEGKGSFAWIISDNKGTVLAQCNGPVYGALVTSFRAEGYGILSLLRFLMRMQQIHDNTGPRATQHSEEIRDQQARSLKSHSLVCDNKSMVDRVNEIIQYDVVFPNTTMDSEWDVLAEIKAAMLALTKESRPEISHIKSHQDRTIPFEELPLKAQLNCQADWLAEAYIEQSQHGNLPMVPLLPTSGCQLHLPQGTITFITKQALKHARSVPPMQAKLCHKYDWSEEDSKNIDWTSHGLALKRLKKHRTTLVKYLNDILWKIEITFETARPPADKNGGKNATAPCSRHCRETIRLFPFKS